MMNWNDIPGWFGFSDAYDRIVASASDNDVFVEVGSWMGRSTAYAATKIRDSGKRILFVAVDHWLGSVEHDPIRTQYCLNCDLYHQFVLNMAACGLLQYICPVRMSSLDASQLFKNGSLHAVWLDASHDEESVLQDISLWRPKVKAGGFIGGDDYTPDWGGVIKAVDRLAPDSEKHPPYWIMNK